MWLFSLFHASRMQDARSHANELSQGYRGSRTRPRTVATWVMTVGLIAAVSGFFFTSGLLLIGGLAVLFVGFLLAFIEAILEMRRN